MNQSKKSAAITICFLATLFYVYDYFIQTFPSVITHQLMQTFQLNATGLGTLAAFFFYAYAVMQLPGGLLLDRLGARRVLTGAVFICAIGVSLFGHAHSYNMAALGRFFIGVGSSVAFISALYLASHWLPKKWFTPYCGLLQATGGIGCIAAQAPLAAAVAHYGWRECLSVLSYATFALVLVYWFFIRDNRKPHYTQHNKRFLRASITRLKEVGKNKQIWYFAIMGATCWLPVATFGTLWGVPYLSHFYDLTATQASAIMLYFWIGLIVACPILGWHSEKIKIRLYPFWVSFIVGLISSLMILFNFQDPIWLMKIAVFGLGISTAGQALAFAGIQDVTSHKTYGTASGIANLIVMTSCAVAQPLVGILMDAHSHGLIKNGVRVYSASDYQFGFIMLPICFIIALGVLYFLTEETHCESKSGSA